MRKPQPWPAHTSPYGDTITRQNDLLVLALYESYYELKYEGNFDLLAGLLPIMLERASAIYEAAVEVGPYIENRPSDKLPLWAKQCNRIVKEYPAIMMRLRGLDRKIKEQRIIDIRRILLEVFTTTAQVQVQLLKIPAGKALLILPVKKIQEMSQEFKR